ncbi:universal stress protein [Methanohalophilus sp.]
MVYSNILVTTDGSENARKAVQSGIELANAFGSKVYALYVMEMNPVGITREAIHRDWKAAMQVSLPEHISPAQWRKFAKIADENWKIERKKHLEEKAENILSYVEEVGKNKGVDVEKVHLEGKPAKEILDFASDKEVNLIVIGTLGMGSDGTFRLGRVAERIIHHASCDVMSVR